MSEETSGRTWEARSGAPSETRSGTPSVAKSVAKSEVTEAGDPVCWLSRVCPECGLFLEDEPPTTCERCGAEVPVS